MNEKVTPDVLCIFTCGCPEADKGVHLPERHPSSKDLGKHPDAWADGPDSANHWMNRAVAKIDQLQQELLQAQRDRNDECRLRRAAEARVTVETKPPQPSETGWLVETPINGAPHWYAFSADRYWTKDANEATRFAREEDADSVIAHYGLVDARATGHEWVASSGQKASADVDAKLKELRERMMATDSTENGFPNANK